MNKKRWFISGFILAVISIFTIAATDKTVFDQAKLQALLTKITGVLNFDSNTLVVDTVNNRVGIGTSTPGLPLAVEGNIYSSQSIRAGETIIKTILSPNSLSFLASFNSNNFYYMASGAYNDISIQGGAIITIYDASGGSEGYVGVVTAGAVTSLGFDPDFFNNADSGVKIRVFRPAANKIRISNQLGSPRAIMISVLGYVGSISNQL